MGLSDPSLVLAWAFELTPEGLKRAEDVDLPVVKTPEISHLDLDHSVARYGSGAMSSAVGHWF